MAGRFWLAERGGEQPLDLMDGERDEAGAAWPSGVRWLVGIAALVLAPAIVWALFVSVPDWLARHDVGLAKPALLQTARDAARGRLLTLAVGLFAAGALV